ncbi:MAG TPA: S8 family serine peptidase [Mycobacteriales bacterium]|nr:S8 family serine peptidase [Mycobacteriales bacterium]
MRRGITGRIGTNRAITIRIAGVTLTSAAIAVAAIGGATAAQASNGHHQWAVVGPTTTSTGNNTPLDLADTESVIGADTSWANGDSGQGIDVAVLDSGVTPVQGLNTPNKVVYGPDLSFDSQDPSTAYLDGFGHGTAMAGLIAGDDGTPGGFEGVAPDARIVSVKVGASNGAVDVSQIIAGIDWVTQHAQSNGLNIRVLNLSLGTDSLQPYQLDPLAHAAEVAWRHGIVVVAAAGNDGADATSLSDPATDPYLIAVGASDSNGTLNPSDDVVADFSSVGNAARHPDLVAPGAYITSLLDPGSYLATTYPAAQIGTRFFRGSGTSQATALTSGAVADLLSSNPNLTPDQLKAALVKSAQSIGTSSKYAVGAGLLDIPGAEKQNASKKPQAFLPSLGIGSLEAARGDAHVSDGGVELTGEQDIFGNPWNARTPLLEELGRSWSAGNWNGGTWTGTDFTPTTFDGSSWYGSTWSGSTWSGSTWSGSSWYGSTWSGSTWSGSTWSGSSWYGSSWYGDTWS